MKGDDMGRMYNTRWTAQFKIYFSKFLILWSL